MAMHARTQERDAHSRINRGLLTFAYVSQRLTRSNDYMQSLIPLFQPIIEDMNGKVFNSSEFAASVNELYELDINEDIVEEFIPRLVREGFLNKVEENRKVAAYTCKAAQEFEDYSNEHKAFTKNLGDILAKFISFVREEIVTLQTVNYSDDYLEKILIEWLIYSDLDFSNASRVLDGRGDEDESSAAPRFKGEDEYLCARFITKLEKEDVALFNEISLIASGAMLSEVILHLQNPQAKKYDFSDFAVYLDGPMLMNLLGLSGNEKKRNTEYIVDNLKKLGCKVRVFVHSIDEAKEVARATLAQNKVSRRGYLADSIRNGEISEEDARLTIANLETVCEQYDLQTVDASSFVTQNEIGRFSDQLKDEFFSKLVLWNNPNARERDALSMQVVLQKRKGAKSNDLFKLKHCMITSNPLLFKISQRFCFDNGLIRENQLGAFVHSRRVSAILFLMLGARERAELSRRQLLANCSRSLVSNPDVIEAMRQKLKAVKPDMPFNFDNLMNIPKYVQLSMDLSLGSEKVIGRENPNKILEMLKDEFAKDAYTEAEEEYKQKSQKDKNKIKSQADDLSKVKVSLTAANDSIELLKESEKQLYQRWLNIAFKASNVCFFFIKAALSAAIVSFGYVDRFQAVNSLADHILWIFGTLLVLVPMWGLHLEDRMKKSFARWLFNKAVTLSGKTEAVTSYAVDFEKKLVGMNDIHKEEGQLL